MALKDKYLKSWSLLPRYNIPVHESFLKDLQCVSGLLASGRKFIYTLESSTFLYGKGHVLDVASFCGREKYAYQ